MGDAGGHEIGIVETVLRRRAGKVRLMHHQRAAQALAQVVDFGFGLFDGLGH